MAAELGPAFRWGIVLRRSKLNADGTEESTDRQEYELVRHIQDNNMGVIVQNYKDIASGWKPGAPRPRYKHALVDLASGTIDGLAVRSIDRLTRQRDQIRPVLDALEAMGGRLLSLEDGLDTADNGPGSNTELRLRELVARAERESAQTSQRMKLMAKHRARRGLHQPSSNRPFGHTVERKRARRGARQLSNIALCGICDSTLIGDIESDSGALVYVCRRRPAAPAACGGINVRAAGADAKVNGKIVALLNDKQRIAALVRRRAADHIELAVIDARYAELEDSKVTLEEAAFNPPAGFERVSRPRYRELRAQIEQEQEQLQHQRRAHGEVAPLKWATTQAWTVERWQAMPIAWRREIIKLVTERIEVAAPVRRGAMKGQVGERFDPGRVVVKLAG